MKILFLDVDGVLNNFSLLYQNGFDYIDPHMVSLVRFIVRQTECLIVLSSSWRLTQENKNLVGVALKQQGMFMHGTTPETPGARSNEISKWLGSNGEVERYAVLDDDEEAGFGMNGSFFQTDPEVGLTEEIAKRIIEHLNGDENE